MRVFLFTIFLNIIMYIAGQDSTSLSDSEIYCNRNPLTWVNALQTCWRHNGSFVPIRTLDDSVTTLLPLKDKIKIWTGDFTASDMVNVSDIYKYPEGYLCGYRSISSGNDTEKNFYDNCKTNKTYKCCRKYAECTECKRDTWIKAIKECLHAQRHLWYGTINTHDSYWVERVLVIKNISKTGDLVPTHPPPASCGVFDVISGLQYLSCGTKLQSFCKLGRISGREVPDSFTKNCFKQQDTTPLSTKSTHGHILTTTSTNSTTRVATNQTSTHHFTASKSSNTESHTYTTVRATDSPPSNTPSASIVTELYSKVSSTRRYSVHKSQENNQPEPSEGYGVKIGLPLTAIVLVSAIVVFVLLWRRRNTSLPKQPREDITNYSETQKSTNKTSKGKPAPEHCNLSYEMTAGNIYSAVNKNITDRGVIHDQTNTSANIATVHGGLDETNGDYAEIYDKAAPDRGVSENEYDTTKTVSRRIETENVYDKTFQADDICNEYDSTDMMASKTVGYKKQGTENVYAKTFQANDSNNDYDSTVTKVNTDKFDNIYDKMNI